MSNIFNEQVVRTKFSDILKQSISENRNVLDQFLPPVFQLPYDPVRDSTTASEACSRLKIKMLAPRAIPELVETDTARLSANFAEGKAWGYLPDTLPLPRGQTEFLPKYKPKHASVPYDLAMFKQIAFQSGREIASNPETGGKLLELYHKIVTNCSFNSGTSIGQLERLRKIIDVANGNSGFHKNKTLKQNHLSRATAASLLEKYMPLGALVKDLPPLTSRLDEYIVFGKHGYDHDPVIEDYLPEINKIAVAGAPFLDMSKKEALAPALITSSAFMNGLVSVISGKTPAQVLFEKYWYFSLSQVIPKGERYDNETVLNKTRNIYAVPMVSNLFGMMLAMPLTNSYPVHASNFDTPSLAKWHPFRGNMHKLLEKMVRRGHHELVYSDNFYISYEVEPGRHDFYSVDLEKGEANATREMVAAVGHYLLTRGWIDDVGSPQFNATWATIALCFCPAWYADITGLFYNLQLKIPGQASGQAWTFLTNHLLSAIVLEEWKRRGKPHPESNDFKEIAAATGIDFKIENSVINLEGQMRDQITNASREGTLMCARPVSGPDEINLDLLGWSAVYSPQLEMFVPVLQYDRLVKSIALPKKEMVYDKEHKLQNRLLDLARLEAAVLVGAWRDPVLQKSIDYQTSVHRKVLRSMGTATDKIVKAMNFHGATEFHEVTKMAELGAVDVVTESAVLTLNKWEDDQPVLRSTPEYALQPNIVETKKAWRARNEEKLERLTSGALADAVSRWKETGPVPEERERAERNVNKMLDDVREIEDLMAQNRVHVVNTKVKVVQPNVASNPYVEAKYPGSNPKVGAMATVMGNKTMTASQKRNLQKKASKKRNKANEEDEVVPFDFMVGKSRKG